MTSHRLVVAAALVASSLSAQSWTQLSPTTSPPARNYHVQCTDTTRGVVVVYGGSAGTDTWEFDGANWVQKTPATSPPPIWYGGMSFDSTRNVCVLFGGRNSTGRLNQTWEWNGTNWRQVATATSPTIRYGHAQCFDSRRNVTVVFSGYNTTPYYSDTWEYDGTNWKQVATTGPVGRIYGRMEYDFIRGKCVLFSGYSAGATPSADVQDTWEWDGVAWKDLKLPFQPLARWGHSMSYVLARGIVMFGGQKQLSPNPGAKNDTWLFDGKGWAEVKPTNPPSARRLHEICAHPKNVLQTVLFGGTAGGGETHVLDLGLFTVGSYIPYGSSCAGTNGSPDLYADPGDAPYINTTFTARLRNIPNGASATLIFGLSNTTWSGANLPMDWSFLGFTGCFLNASLDLWLPMATAGTTASLPAPIPNTASLVGLTYYNQALVIDAGANTAGATLSNGAAGTVGRQ